MSLESQIQTLTEAIDNLAFIIKQQAVLQAAAPVAAPVVKLIPEPEPRPIPVEVAPPSPAPVVEVAPPAPVAAVEVAPPAVVMPALPTFMVAAPAPAKSAPFTDAKGLMDYVMTSYTALGAEKGSKIQDIMVSLGFHHINDITAASYGVFFEKVEALK